jgi:ornithine--oxo-acid transaminase
LRGRLGGTEFVREVRGRGMMIGIELGPPRNLRLKAAYALLEQANEGLFCQLLLMTLLARHRILAQVAGHAVPVIKLLPPFVVSEDDLLWIESSFQQVLHEADSLGGIWELGRTLAGQALRARTGAP